MLSGSMNPNEAHSPDIFQRKKAKREGEALGWMDVSQESKIRSSCLFSCVLPGNDRGI